MPLSAPQIAARLLPGWTHEDGQIVRTFETGNWQRGQMLACAIGYLAEAANHHPDLLLTYPRVRVMLSTHEEDGITDRDFELAERIEALAGLR
jgi:4a-hydroxytetrahydrobiopterin dehydratase